VVVAGSIPEVVAAVIAHGAGAGERRNPESAAGDSPASAPYPVAAGPLTAGAR
jgi:hypothetical protein